MEIKRDLRNFVFAANILKEIIILDRGKVDRLLQLRDSFSKESSKEKDDDESSDQNHQNDRAPPDQISA